MKAHRTVRRGIEYCASGRLRLLAIGALVAGASVAALVGYASRLFSGVFLLSAAVLAGSPYAARTARFWFRSVRTPSGSQLDAVARALAYASPDYVLFRPPELRDLSDEELCRRWRESCKTSPRRPSAAQLTTISAERQEYLEELERRNPNGIAAWLAAGPQREKDPLPYLTGEAGPVVTVDWDELTRGTG